MNIVKKVFRNSLWLGGAQIGSRGFSILITIILARYLGTQDFGRYSLIYAYCGIFGILTDIGIDMIVVREASKDLKRGEVLVGNGIALKAGFALLAVVLASAAAHTAGMPSGMVGLIMLASLSFLVSPLSLYAAVFPAKLELRYPALLDLAGRSLSLVFILSAILMKGTLVAVVWAMLATAACQTILTVLMARRLFRPVFRLDTALWRDMLSEAWPIAINNLLIMLILRVDQVMIERICPDGTTQLGLYSAAVKYCEIFNYLPAIFFASVFPLLSRFSSEEGKETFRNLYTLSFKYLTMAILPIALFSSFYAGKLMAVLYGESFVGSARSTQILIWSEPFVFMAWVFINTAVSQGLQRLVLPVAVAAMVANVSLNVWLIPERGAEGAALASLVSYALVLPLTAMLPQLRHLVRSFLQSAVRPAGATALLAILLWRFPLDPVAGTAVILSAFLVLMILSGALNRGDLALAQRMIARDS